MRIGYPCINWTVDCNNNKTFRLKSYSERRLKKTIENNVDCLLRILKFNEEHKIFFFRITSDLVPFASHPINKFDWQNHFGPKFQEIGDFVRRNRMRISMHPDQFTLVNSIDRGVFRRSCKELAYHSSILDLMKLDTTAKIQVHVGGAYMDKKKSMERFIERFFELENCIRKRLVVENDDRLYDLRDCLSLSSRTDLPILFDVFHHRIHGNGEAAKKAIQLCSRTWRKKADGVPMVDYSSQKTGASIRQHAESIDLHDFNSFLTETSPLDFDIMLEIKDKEKSAIKAIEAASGDARFLNAIGN